ncbi:MAG: class I SAM-dependent methyltransferase [Candidatus Bathyarchaeota archaeon]|nr:MAG: class I SAM-dependent methyltransferase [Candidatus Bathyarchaeota archaeon]
MRYYNNIARFYDEVYGEEQELKIQAAIESLQLPIGSFVLDLGCGTGLLIPKLMRIAECIVCIDMSRTMIERVDLKTRRLENVHMILADADHTPLRQGDFDVIFAITLLQNMPDPNRTLREIRYNAKPEALIVVTGLKKHFSRKDFLKLLKEARLETKSPESDNILNCHVATCTKH